MNTKPFDIEKVQAGDPVVTDENGAKATYIGPHDQCYVFWTFRDGYELYNDCGQPTVGRSLRPPSCSKLVMAPKTKRVTVWTRHYRLIKSGVISCTADTDPAHRILAESRFINNGRAKWIAPAFPTTYEIEE